MGKKRRRAKTESPAAAPQPPAWRFPAIAVGLILLLTLGIYSQTRRFGFTNYDDPQLVLENTQLRSLDLARIFAPETGRSYQPLRVLSYAIDYRIGGYNPAGYHLHNLLLHALAGVLLFFFLRALLPDLRTPHPEYVALGVALLFVVHPVNVESVAWVTSRKYGLLAVFSFATLLLALRSQQDPERQPAWLGGAVATWVAALLASPFAVVLPLIVLLVTYSRSELTLKDRATWPWLIALALALPAQIFLLSAAVSTAKIINGPGAWALAMPRVLVDYLRNLLLPLWLNARYVDHVALSWKHGLALVLVAAAAYWIWRELQAGRKLAALAIGWFFIWLAPVANIIPISHLMADRYLYIAAVGLFLLVGAALARLGTQGGMIGVAALLALTIGAHKRAGVWKSSEALWQDSIEKDPANDVACANLGAAFQDAGQLFDAARWFQECLALNTDFADAHANLGTIQVKLGNLAGGLASYERALELNPDDDRTCFNIGVSQEQAGDDTAAIESYSRAIGINPNAPEYHVNLGAAHLRLGELEAAESALLAAQSLDAKSPQAQLHLGGVFTARENWQQALYHYESALAVAPAMPDAKLGMLRLAEALGEQAPPSTRRYRDAAAASKQGDQYRAQKLIDLATQKYQASLQLDPSAVEAHMGLGVIALEGGAIQAAFSRFQEILRLTPDHYPAHSCLGSMYFALKQMDQARPHFEALIRINPNSDEGYNNLGAYYFGQESYDRAIPLLQRALMLKPNYFMALRNLGACFAATGRSDQALQYYQRAAAINPDDPQTQEFLYVHGVK
ncbi:MAG: tetratricopeptide (TPR) repeat protein [Rhodothermales bacterium]|jgi:tetratricopeptide (TPR) repeat protein